MIKITLASSSLIRRQLLENVGLCVDVQPVNVDETAIRETLLAQGTTPRDMADALADHKARRAAHRMPGGLILAADQILARKGEIFSKPECRQSAAQQLASLTGQTHHLYSAAVIYEDGRPVWRHVGTARLVMHQLSADQIDAYLQTVWPDVQGCVGGYQAESHGAKLFSRIEGDWFSVLGLPLLDVLSYLRLRGDFE